MIMIIEWLCDDYKQSIIERQTNVSITILPNEIKYFMNLMQNDNANREQHMLNLKYYMLRM